MAKPKFKNVLKTKKVAPGAAEKVEAKKSRKDPRIQSIREEYFEFDCPVRGRVKQKVKIKRYKPAGEFPGVNLIKPSAFDAAEKLDEVDDGLSIYREDEDTRD